MEYPRISIITPSYNAMPYVEATIKSVLDQQYPNLEHLVIDGASTDNSVEVFKTYPHIIWESEKDRGQSHALNKGFARTTGDIIGWLNADDVYTPGTFQKVVDYFRQHPETDLVGTDINIIDKAGSIIGFTKSGEFNVVDLLSFNMIKQPTVFMRRRVIDALQGVDESLHYVMDQEFWLRVGMHRFKFDYLKGEVFANFRLIEGTKTFESGLAFHEEWYQLISRSIDHPVFAGVSKSKKTAILAKSYSRVNFHLMMDAAANNERTKALGFAAKMVKNDPGILKNLGLFKIIFKLAFKIEIDKLAKFRKNAAK